MSLKALLAVVVIVAGICIGLWAIAQTTQMQGDHNQGIMKTLEGAGIKPATSSSPSR